MPSLCTRLVPSPISTSTLRSFSALNLRGALALPQASNPLPRSIPGRTTMTPTQDAFFGGPIYLSESRVWSKYHSVDNCGGVEDRDEAPDLYDIVLSNMDVSAVGLLTHSV